MNLIIFIATHYLFLPTLVCISAWWGYRNYVRTGMGIDTASLNLDRGRGHLTRVVLDYENGKELGIVSDIDFRRFWQRSYYLKTETFPGLCNVQFWYTPRSECQ